MTFDLLDAVQPKDGWFCAVGIKGRSIVQKLVQTREELDELADQFVADKRNAFFAVAKFQTDADRKKDNVQSLKAFWLDIDCGPTKAEVNEKTGRPDGYADQDSGKEALDAFCELVQAWEKRLFYYIRRLVDEEQDAWQILQDTWVKVLSGI